MNVKARWLPGLVAFSLFTCAWAADVKVNSSAIAFLQKYKELYASEIHDATVYSRPLTVRNTISPYDASLHYDDSKSEIAMATQDIFQRRNAKDLEVMESCARTGEGMGT